MNLLNALAKVGSMTMISRVLGFVRDTLIARVFGAGMMTDAFFVAFKIPNLLRRLFAEGAFAQAFVPVLAEYKTQRGQAETKALIDHVATFLGLILVAVALLGVLLAPFIVTLTAPGFVDESEKFSITVNLLRIIFPYIFFISLVSLAGGILNTYSKFSVPAFTPTLLNVSFIIATLFFAPYFDPPIMVLAWAVVIGGVLQLAFQIPFLMKIGMLPSYRLNIQDPGVWRILKLMGPAIFGVSVAQISILINNIFASFLQTGSVSWLYYADRLMEFPTGLLGVALGTILLPSLAKAFSDKSSDEYSQLMDWGLRLTLLLALPAAVALALLAVPLVCSLFFYGAFTENDVWMTRQALMAYSLGLLGLIMVKVLAPGFYARQNIKTPVKIAIFTLVATQIMNLIFVFGLDLKHAGLALAIGLGACINAGLLYFHLRKHQIYQPQAGWGVFFVKVMIAIIVMVGLLYLATGDSQTWLEYSFLQRLWHLTGLVLLGVASYFGTLFLLGFRLKDFSRRTAN